MSRCRRFDLLICATMLHTEFSGSNGQCGTPLCSVQAARDIQCSNLRVTFMSIKPKVWDREDRSIHASPL